MPHKQVFVSHISAEGALAAVLKKHLEDDFLGMLDVFVSSDRETIAAGSRWLDAVERALDAADVHLVLCSPASVGRPWVNFEAGAAWIRKVPLVPLCHSGMTPATLPVPLSMVEAVVLDRAGLTKLYDTLARLLGVTTPAADLGGLAAELAEVQQRLGARGEAVETVTDPHVLCAASAQYAEPRFGFDLDVEVLRSVFGEDRVTVERALTRRRLTELLTGGRFDIVHLVTLVDPASGDLVFSPVDPLSREPTTARVDRLPAPGFSALLAETGARLVVLATCNALLLAVEVAHVANMAASDTDISGAEAAEWEETFYSLLAQGRSVFRALDLARSAVDVPIRGIRHHDVAFSVPRS